MVSILNTGTVLVERFVCFGCFGRPCASAVSEFPSHQRTAWGRFLVSFDLLLLSCLSEENLSQTHVPFYPDTHQRNIGHHVHVITHRNALIFSLHRTFGVTRLPQAGPTASGCHVLPPSSSLSLGVSLPPVSPSNETISPF